MRPDSSTQLELSASLMTTDDWLRAALDIKLSNDGHPMFPNGFDDSMAKDWLLTVVDDDLKSRLKGANGDQIQRDQTVMDTARRT